MESKDFLLLFYVCFCVSETCAKRLHKSAKSTETVVQREGHPWLAPQNGRLTLGGSQATGDFSAGSLPSANSHLGGKDMQMSHLTDGENRLRDRDEGMETALMIRRSRARRGRQSSLGSTASLYYT